MGLRLRAAPKNDAPPLPPRKKPAVSSADCPSPPLMPISPSASSAKSSGNSAPPKLHRPDDFFSPRMAQLLAAGSLLLRLARGAKLAAGKTLRDLGLTEVRDT